MFTWWFVQVPADCRKLLNSSRDRKARQSEARAWPPTRRAGRRREGDGGAGLSASRDAAPDSAGIAL